MSRCISPSSEYANVKWMLLLEILQATPQRSVMVLTQSPYDATESVENMFAFVMLGVHSCTSVRTIDYPVKNMHLLEVFLSTLPIKHAN